MISSALLRRYFGDVEADEKEDRQRKGEEIGRKHEFITRSYYGEFKATLESQLRHSRIRPGAHDEMLYATGVNDGIQWVLDHLSDIETQCREHITKGE